MTVTLLILRHAPTVWNRQRRLQGRTDEPLSEEGRAVAATWRLPPGAMDRRWHVSPLSRARQTAAILNLVPEEERNLAEMSWGAWEGLLIDDLRREGLLTPTMEAMGLDLRPPEGESPRDVQERLRIALAEWAKGVENRGAVAHNGVIRALYALATGWNMRDKPAVKLRDQCAHLFGIAPDGTPSVLEMNIPLTQ